MWNNHQLLNSLANVLFVTVILAVLYTVNLRYIKLPIFPINEISIKPINGIDSGDRKLRNITYEQIEEILRDEITGNFVTIDLTAVRQAFKELPWVRKVKVLRNWPDGLEVLLEEHVVLAHWGSSALVNTYGEVFRATIDSNLPVFTGPREESSHEVARQYAAFTKILDPLQQPIAEINLSPRYAWRIRLQTGTVLELGRDEVEKRLARYTSVYNQSIAQLNQLELPAYMDLRYSNGFAVRMPQAVQKVPGRSSMRKET
ncbi:MAG: cell division protein FtsQ/DivIB [Nitrosomonas sp.]|nr:cell division protein FtsQ/DivIB [Nitrosomonas sp.]MDP1949642.1 cell division protein FtsQ/DivIB [Nitrosomonas sp.]